MYTLENNNTSPFHVVCTITHKIKPLLTLPLVKSTPRAYVPQIGHSYIY